MTQIDYSEAYKRLMEQYLKYGQRADEEQRYINRIESLGLPIRDGVVKRHKQDASAALYAGSGVWDALMILQTLKAEADNAAQE